MLSTSSGLQAAIGRVAGVDVRTGGRFHGFADRSNLEYFMVSLQFEGLWFVADDEEQARDFDRETRMHTNLLLVKVFVG